MYKNAHCNIFLTEQKIKPKVCVKKWGGTGHQLNRLWCIHVTEYYLDTKNNE